jgi:hypothetical protein
MHAQLAGGEWVPTWLWVNWGMHLVSLGLDVRALLHKAFCCSRLVPVSCIVQRSEPLRHRHSWRVEHRQGRSAERAGVRVRARGSVAAGR